MSVCPVSSEISVDAVISETIRARLLGFSMQIPELYTQRKYVYAQCVCI